MLSKKSRQKFNFISLIVDDLQGILCQQLSPRPIRLLIFLLISYIKLYIMKFKNWWPSLGLLVADPPSSLLSLTLVAFSNKVNTETGNPY
jgi:hypothetical protein